MRYDSVDDLPPALREQAKEKLGLGRTPMAAPAPKRAAEKSELMACFDALLATRGRDLPKPIAEHLFADEVVPVLVPKRRKFRLDRAWCEQRVAVEIDGGTFGRPVRCHRCHVAVRAVKQGGLPGGIVRTGGRHTQGEGYDRDCVKRNLAQALGWVVLHVTGTMMRSGDGGEMLIAQLRYLLGVRSGKGRS